MNLRKGGDTWFFEKGRTRYPSVENSLWKRLWTCRKTDEWMIEWMYEFFFHAATTPIGLRPPHCRSFTITFRHAILGRNPPCEWLARRRELYLTTRVTHKRHISMSLAGFQSANPSQPVAAHPRIKTARPLGSALNEWYLLIILEIYGFIIS